MLLVVEHTSIVSDIVYYDTIKARFESCKDVLVDIKAVSKEDTIEPLVHLLNIGQKHLYHRIVTFSNSIGPKILINIL